MLTLSSCAKSLYSRLDRLSSSLLSSQHTRLFFHHGSKRVPKEFHVLSRSDVLFLISQVPINPSPIGPTSRANSKGDSLNSGTTFPRNQEQSFPQRKTDIISTSHMHALGVCTISFTSCDIPHILNQNSAHRTLIVRKLKGLENIIPYTSVHWEMLEKGSYSPTTLEATLSC